MKPFIVRFENQTERGFDVTIHASTCDAAREFARHYFGCSSVDFRNRNRVEYLHSDFDSTHTFHVTTPEVN